jgi:hypothetical protein
MVMEIPLTKGKCALVDAEDFERINSYSWFFERGYARRRFQRSGVQHCMHMHREIVKAPEGFEVDHINGDTLDNRKANLRIVTHRRNMHNMAAHSDSSSKYRGVYWNKQKGKWTVQICLDGKRQHIGHFVIEADAARAYNSEAIRLFGQYARLNQI